MSFHEHSILWPQAKELFPEQQKKDVLPTEIEVQLRLTELYASGDVMTGSKLELWWNSIPEQEKQSKKEQELYPSPEEPALQESVKQAFQKLAEKPIDSQSSVVYKPWRIQDFLLPGLVILLTVAFMIGSAILFTVNHREASDDGYSRLDRFPQEPTVVAPSVNYSGQKTSPVELAPERSSSIFETVYYYKINDDFTLTPTPTEGVEELWARALAVFGADAKKLTKLGVAYGNGFTGIAGYVDFDDKTLVMNVDEGLHDESIQLFTLVHEYNHLVTLADQYAPANNSCSTVIILDGGACLAQDSSLYRWTQQFWSEPGMLDNVSTGDIAAGDERYAAYPDQFVSVYAASAPQEDMAESFATWMFGFDLPAEKEQFFVNDPESAALKSRILQGISQLHH